jgi:hypothetical protein
LIALSEIAPTVACAAKGAARQKRLFAATNAGLRPEEKTQGSNTLQGPAFGLGHLMSQGSAGFVIR